MKRLLENILLSARPKTFGTLCAVAGLVGTSVILACALWAQWLFLAGYCTCAVLFWCLVIIEVSK